MVLAAFFGYFSTMPRRQPELTIDQMVVEALRRSGLGLTAWCKSKNLNPRLVFRWRFEEIERPRLAKIIAFADAVEHPVEAVQAALEKRMKG